MRTITAIETGKDWTLKVIFGDGALRIYQDARKTPSFRAGI